MDGEKKKNSYKLIIIIGILMLLSVAFVFLYRHLNDGDEIIKAAKNYIETKEIIVKDTHIIKISELLNAGYKFKIKGECTDRSYVQVTNKNNKLNYETIMLCTTAEITINLIGKEKLVFEVGDDYVEEGAVAFYDKEDVSDEIEIDIDGLNLNKTGVYQINYTISVEKESKTVKRIVEVRDTKVPDLVLNGNSEVTLLVGEKYEELGAVAHDSYDGNLTDKIIITGEVNTKKADTYEITYSVEDLSGNRIEIKRTIIVKDVGFSAIKLKGTNNVIIEYGNKYTEPGYSATDTIDGDITGKVTIKNSVNYKKVGSYKITYSVINSTNITTNITRTVTIRDNEKPTLTLKGESYVSIRLGDEYIESGATAHDNYDGDITSKIMITGYIDSSVTGKQYITYTVVDSSGNKKSVQRTIEVLDVNEPTITMLGDNPYYLVEGTNYIEPGATAVDNYDKSVKVTIFGNVNIDVIGTYPITYTAIDKAGNIATEIRKVIVIEQAATPEECFKFATLTNSITGYYGISETCPGDVIIPRTINGIPVTKIGHTALSDSNLTSIVMRDNIISIGTYAFYKNQLTNVTIPESVTVIGDYIFYQNQLENVIIPEGVTTIGKGTFSANKLTSINIPESVTKIGSSAFSANKLTTVRIPDGVTAIEGSTFAFNQLETVIFPKNLETMGSFAFQGNQFRSIIIPNTVKSMAYGVFTMNYIEQGNAMIDNSEDGIQLDRDVFSNNGPNKNKYIEPTYLR